MPEQNRPVSPAEAPDPAHSYERAKPERESVAGNLQGEKSPPRTAPDRSDDATSNQQVPERQINADDGVPDYVPPAANQPDHSMHDEEPDGWDLAPNDISDPQQKRHPRIEGKGGTP